VGCNKAIEGGPIEHCKLRIAHGDRSGGARFAGEHSHLAQQVSLAQFGKQAARGRDAAAVPVECWVDCWADSGAGSGADFGFGLLTSMRTRPLRIR